MSYFMALAGITISYLLGSLPTAYIFGRVLKGIDIRKFGSGNVGATNAFRVLGPTWGVVVLIVDVLKGVVAVTAVANYFLNYLQFSPDVLRILCGLACVCGHNWTLILRFRGGKGVATTLGVLAGLGIVIVELRMVLFLEVLVWVTVFLIFRIVSLASILSALTLPLLMLILGQSKELLILSVMLGIIIVVRHKKNLLGLIRGEERFFSFKKKI